MICNSRNDYSNPNLNFSEFSKDIEDLIPEQLRNVLPNLDSYPSSYQNYFEDLQKYQYRITPTEFSYALVTILAIAVLEREVDVFSKISNDVDRENTMTQRLYLPVERAFTKGTTPLEVRDSILKRVKDVQRIYKKAKEQNSLLGFFRDAFVGPPCFNGRLITMLEYESLQLDSDLFELSHLANVTSPCLNKSLTTGPEEYERIQWELQARLGGKTDFDHESVQIEELLYGFQSNYETEEVPELAKFVQYLKSIPEYEKKWGELIGTERFQKIYERACNIFESGDL